MCSPKTGVSFTAKIDELQESEVRLTCELNKWRNEAATELEMRRQAEEKVNHLQNVIKESQKELVNWLLQSPSHRHIAFKHIASFALGLGLEGYGTEAIRTAFRKEGYGRRIAKRKRFSDDPVVMAHRVQFA